MSNHVIAPLKSAPTAPPAGAARDTAPATTRDAFRRFASWTSTATGSPWAFIIATLTLILWALSYPLFKIFPNAFDTWQLVINTLTTIVTFLMVFLIQNTQNRDAKAIHLKLDELIRAHKGARNRLVELESCSDEELESLKKEFEKIRAHASGKPAQRAEAHLATLETEQTNRTTDA